MIRRFHLPTVSAIAALALLAGTVLGSTVMAAQGPGPGGMRGRGPGGPGAGPGGRGAGIALRALDLTEAQREQMRQLTEQHREQTRTLAERVRAAAEAQREAMLRGDVVQRTADPCRRAGVCGCSNRNGGTAGAPAERYPRAPDAGSAAATGADAGRARGEAGAASGSCRAAPARAAASLATAHADRQRIGGREGRSPTPDNSQTAAPTRNPARAEAPSHFAVHPSTMT